MHGILSWIFISLASILVWFSTPDKVSLIFSLIVGASCGSVITLKIISRKDRKKAERIG